MAGLAAARALLEGGLRVVVLEASERVGGRILTVRADGETVELGAEFVHGRPPELLALIREAGLEVYERNGQMISFEDGLLSVDDGREEMFAPLERLKEFRGEDVSFAAYLDREGVEGEARGSAIGYVEGFNAADATVASARALGVQQAAEGASEGDRVFRVREGYDRVPEFLLSKVRELGGEVRLGAEVREVRWERGRVEIETSAGFFEAVRCVVTLPLGVLEAGRVRFVPEPAGVMEAAKGMRMGQVCRFTIVFRTRFWTRLEPQPEMQSMSFLFAFAETPSVWWTSAPEETRTLVGWVGGPRSEPLLAKLNDELAGEAARTLAKIFALEEAWVWEQVVGFYRHDWRADSRAMGSYSYVAVGGVEASARMSEPVEETLYFAGEHADVSGHWGTVHGAMRSGLRAAGQVLASRDK